MFLKQITDTALAQNAYLIACQRTGEAVIIDPERDVDRYLDLAASEGFKIVAVADTHIHADYLSGARELVEHHGAVAYLSADGGEEWQFEWAKTHTSTRFLSGGDSFSIGKIRFEALSSPGHTPEHLSFLVTDLGGGASGPMALLSGDFIFVGDVGRPDLLESAAGQVGNMEPSARTLFASLRATEKLPGYIQILPAHGAGSACGKSLGAIPTSVLGYERLNNGALRQAISGNEEYAAGHVRGATNIAHTRLAVRLEELPVGDPLFVHCGSGVRAIMSVPFLARTGREVIYVDGAFGDLPSELIADKGNPD
jgi:hydroxyacylglutathione hydrolase